VSPSTLPPVRTLPRTAAPSRRPASQSIAALSEPHQPPPCPAVPMTSPATPYRRLATTRLSASVPLRRPACGLRAVTTPPAGPTRAQNARSRGPLRDWIGPPDRDPASLSAGHAWQAATPVDCGPGLDSALHCATIFLIIFQLI
jgi:hypothetical protein